MGKQNGDLLSPQKGERLLLLLERLWHPLVEVRLSEVDITEIRVRGPRNGLPDITVIVKGEADGQKFVAFHSADSAGDAVKGALERLLNNQLKWREDRPFKE